VLKLFICQRWFNEMLTTWWGKNDRIDRPIAQRTLARVAPAFGVVASTRSAFLQGSVGEGAALRQRAGSSEVEKLAAALLSGIDEAYDR
jgi:hypothetical protein